MSGSISPFTATMFSLMLLNPARHGGVDAGQHARQIVAPGDLFEAFAVERVEVNIKPVQTGIVKRLRVTVRAARHSS